MKNRAFWFLVAGLLAGLPQLASADHLGPVVLGVERFEQVRYCYETKTLDRLVQIDEAWAKKDPTGQLLSEAWTQIRPLLDENQCSANEISYTPRKVLRQWQGRSRINGVVRPATFSLVEASAQKIDGTLVSIYVITREVPPQSTPQPPR